MFSPFNPISATCDAYQAKFGPIIQPGNAHSIFSAWIQGPIKLPMYFKKGPDKGGVLASCVTQAQASQSLKQAKVRLYAGLVAATAAAVAMAILAIAANVSSVAFIANPITLSVLGTIALIAAAVSLVAHAKFKNSIHGKLGLNLSSVAQLAQSVIHPKTTPTPPTPAAPLPQVGENDEDDELEDLSGVENLSAVFGDPNEAVASVSFPLKNDGAGKAMPSVSPLKTEWFKSAQSSWLADEDDVAGEDDVEAPQGPKAEPSFLSATGKVGSFLSGIGSFLTKKPTPAPAPQE